MRSSQIEEKDSNFPKVKRVDELGVLPECLGTFHRVFTRDDEMGRAPRQPKLVKDPAEPTVW